MNELSARLEALLRHYGAAFDGESEAGPLGTQFRTVLRMLIAEYGVTAVEAALDDIPDDTTPSIAPY
jgi:hypothetical protein